MPEINYVAVYITPDQIAEGFYTLSGNVLTMVDGEDGNPVRMKDGEPFPPRILREGEDARVIAGLLTKEIRKYWREINFPKVESVSGFDAQINYPRMGVA